MNTVQKLFSSIGAFFQIVGITVVLLLIGHFLLAAALPEPRLTDARAKAPVYDNFPEREEFWIEQKRAWQLQFEPYYHWRRKPFVGKHTNIDENGIRRTVPTITSEDAKTIFVLGGSTTWGSGAEDAGTIPSHLQARLGERFRVLNYGESGYTSTQELNYLMYQLAKGNVPDLVIFYDGVNDGYAGVYSPAIPRDPENLRDNYAARDAKKAQGYFLKMLLESNYGQYIKHKTQKRGKAKYAEWDEKISPDIEAKSQAVLEMYEAHIRQVNALGKAYGFDAIFVWQPHLFSMTRKHLSPFEEKVIKRSSEVLVDSQRKLYQMAKSQFANRTLENIHFFGDLFDDVTEPIYIDWHHMASNGNAIVADAIYQAMQPLLQSNNW